MFIICSRHRPSRRSPGRRSDGPGHGPMKPESAGFGPNPGKTRGFLADTIVTARDSETLLLGSAGIFTFPTEVASGPDIAPEVCDRPSQLTAAGVKDSDRV